MINFKAILCKLIGHLSDPPIIEVWESQNSMQKSIFLCRRCFIDIGGKSYV